MKESCVSRMQMSDIRRNIVGLWSDTAASWQDDMSKKYRIALIDQMGELLDSMQNSCGQLACASDDALRRLKEIQE